MRRTCLGLSVAIVAAAALLPGRLAAQTYRWGGTEFNAVREVRIPSETDCSIVVTQFFHHGEIAPDGKNVAVRAQDKEPVPVRVLQLGPGDYCRLAFQRRSTLRNYEIYYGGDPPDEEKTPKWTNNAGLLLETREYRQCNLNSLESVRSAFESSKPFGSNYVDSVRHSFNPFSLKPEPFLSYYSGYLHVPSAGMYGFLTSSQDCSFLLIDGKLVVAAPGRHRPQRRALRGSRKDIRLSAGAHKFEYYHAASGPEAMMVAAWEVSPKSSKPAPKAIPSEAFRTGAIGRAEAGSVSMRSSRLVPDFVVGIAGDVPLPDNDLALIGVKFIDKSPKSLTLQARIEWDFGDGQTSEVPDPEHVYLHPGLYTVKLAVHRGDRSHEMVNRVRIDRPVLTRNSKLHELDDYLPIIQKYNPKTLNALGLCQLVLAYQWKSDKILAGEEPEKEKGKGNTPEEEEPAKPPGPEEARKQRESRRAKAMSYVKTAVEAGKAPFLEDAAAKEDEHLVQLARLVGPMARNQLGDSRLAARIWHGASQKVAREDLKAECRLAAADIALNDLVDRNTGKSLLDAATEHLRQAENGPLASRLARVWGDYYAIAGDGEEARKSYRQAEGMLADKRTQIERIAWQGAHNRSTEEFLKTGELDRAAAQIRAWEREFPADKIGGLLTLLYARYWAGREMYAQAVALAEQLLVVNPDSPYMDQLLVVAADCEAERSRIDRALATLHSLLNDYPGSPLVPEVRKKIAALEAKQKPSSR